MSRREFRLSVEAPRSVGALLMVASASATLDITGQIAPWAIAVQVLCLATAFARRERPLAWQRSPVVLNATLLLCVGLAAGMVLRGTSEIIALAHFATLTQGLQILDARARRTEFLLVALALFQVILAANLTDSVAFPPLLVVFLLATVWTLLVHTLRAEALEANDPLAASRVTTPGLLRTTLVASSLSVGLALLLFLVLPRMRSAVLPGAGFGTTIATAGFSDRVELGELGRIRRDPTVVLRVETLSGEPPGPRDRYWRGLAFDTFDGRRWSVTPPERVPVPGQAEFGIDLRPGGPPPDLVQRIVREPVTSGVLFADGQARRLEATGLARIEQDVNGGLYVPSQQEERLSYTVASVRSRPQPAALEADRAVPPPGDGGRYLQLPPLSPSVAALARRITAGAGSDAGRAAAIEAFLLRRGRYTDTPPTLDPADPRSPVELFLEGDLAGHCEYFASAMVVLGRSVGLPMRLVNGFAGGRDNPYGGFHSLARSDAHAWVEVHFEHAGWVRFDPTPADLRLASAEEGLGAQLAALGSAIELWWFQRIVEFDRSDQVEAVRAAWLAWRRWRATSHAAGAAEPARASGHPERLVDPHALAAAAGLCALLLVAARLWRRRRGALEVPAFYARALRLLARRGLVRAPQTTPRAFARRLAQELPAPAARAFHALTESYLAARYGGHPAPDTAEPLEVLRAALARRARPRSA